MTMASAAALNRRVYLVVEEGAPGMVRMRLSLHPPECGGAMAALLSRGMMLGEDLTIDLVSDPSANPALRGPKGDHGASAYQVARALGYGGTATQWLATLKGDRGDKGDTGAKGDRGLPGTTAVADIVVTQTATVAIAAGVRRVTIAVPAAAGLAANDPVTIAPVGAVPNGYAIHDARAVSSTSLSVALTCPALAIGASYAISCRVFRLG